jgi:hypothetical protein
MCSEACPCYTDLEGDQSQITDRIDPWFKYSQVSDELLEEHSRAFTQAFDSNHQELQWSTSRENSYESFYECFLS